MIDLLYPTRLAELYPAPSADNPSPKIIGEGEILPVVESDGQVIGRASRNYIHRGSGLLHPVVHLHIINRMGELYLQKRSMNKDLLPGFWDTAVGGHVDYGEQITEALYREAQEELNLLQFNPIYLTSYVYENEREREFVSVFATVGSFDIKPHNDEVEEGKYWSQEEIENNLDKSVFTPNFEKEFSMFGSSLSALL